MKHCPVCGRDYEPLPEAKGMPVDCPHCLEGRTIGVTDDVSDWTEIRNCVDCGAELHAGERGARWGRCPSCDAKLEFRSKAKVPGVVWRMRDFARRHWMHDEGQNVGSFADEVEKAFEEDVMVLTRKVGSPAGPIHTEGNQGGQARC